MRLGLSGPHSPSVSSIRHAVFLGLIIPLAACACGCGVEEMQIAHNQSQSPVAPTGGRPAREAPATPKLNEAPALYTRKIIYDARIDLLVKSLDATERAVLELIKDHNGFLAESNIAAQTGTRRDATWRVRVPVDQFDPFVSAVAKLGEVRTNHVGSQDVTEEFADPRGPDPQQAGGGDAAPQAPR